MAFTVTNDNTAYFNSGNANDNFELPTDKFMGSTVISFTEDAGWGSENSTLSVTLYDCAEEGDIFTPPAIGSPVTFTFGTHTFSGIFDKYTRSDTDGSSREVSVITGSDILSGVQLIINDYFGATNSVPNVINVFGYNENQLGFGGAGTNEAGMSWETIRDTVHTITTDSGVNDYGAPISYKGYKYEINMSGLPSVPSYYRISGDSIDLLSFVQDVCDAGGHDFIIKLSTSPKPGIDGTFTVQTIDRTNEPVDGKITDFINSQSCFVSREVGLESRIGTNNKFVVGANVEDVFFNTPQNTGDQDYTDDTVLPFFGYDVNGNVIIGSGDIQSGEYFFDIDVRDIGHPNIGETYTTSINELRHAKRGRESWELFLSRRNFNQYIIEDGGASTEVFDYLPPGETIFRSVEKFGYRWTKTHKPTIADSIYFGNKYVTYKHNGNENVYNNRASDLGVVSGAGFGYVYTFEDDMETLASGAYEDYLIQGGIAEGLFNELHKLNMDYGTEEKEDPCKFGFRNAQRTGEIYKRLKIIADKYLGKKYMVTIPFLYVATEPESFNIKLSHQPVNEGYIDENDWPTAYSLGLIPNYSGVNDLVNQNNKFGPFVKYSGALTIDESGTVSQRYDFSDLPENSKVYNAYSPTASGEVIVDVWVKCQVSPEIAYLDQETLSSPRAIIELPAPVKTTEQYCMDDYANLRNMIVEATGPNRVFYGLAGDPSGVEDLIKKKLGELGSDMFRFDVAEGVTFADLYAIPLRSNILSYGPWYSIGADGPTEYERDTSLAPWNYGGFDAMGIAGAARASSASTDQTFEEAGSITLNQAPLFDIGDQLIAGGPYITNIGMSLTEQGMSTTYSLQTWSTHKRLEGFSRYNVDRLKRMSKTSENLRRIFREGAKNGKWVTPNDFFNSLGTGLVDLNNHARRQYSGTSQSVIVGRNNGSSSSVYIQPFYNAQNQMEQDYNYKSAMSLDGLFRPFSVTTNEQLPTFKIVPSGEIDFGNNAVSFNPLQSGHDIRIIAGNSGIPEQGLANSIIDQIDSDGEDEKLVYRGIGMRFPMIGVGWGRDDNGNPFPSDSGNNRIFSDDYNYNPKNWKAGPVHIPFDSAKGIWDGGNNVKVGFLGQEIDTGASSFITRSSGIVHRFTHREAASNEVYHISNDIVSFWDPGLGVIQSGTMVFYTCVDNTNIPIYVSCEVDSSVQPYIRYSGV